MRYSLHRKPRRAHRGGLGAVMFVLMGLAGMAHAVDHDEATKADPVVAEYLVETVVESPTWQEGYILIEGIDDYGYGLIETTPNEEVAGERVVRFEDFAQLAVR